MSVGWFCDGVSATLLGVGERERGERKERRNEGEE